MSLHHTSPILCLVNGYFTHSVDVRDRALHYGDGLFETLTFTDNKLTGWPEHYQRLCFGASCSDIERPEEDVLLKEIFKLISLCEFESGVIKIILSRGVSNQRGYGYSDDIIPSRVVFCYPHVSNNEYIKEGIHAKLCMTRLARKLENKPIKHLNRIEQVDARRELCVHYTEGLMLDTAGSIIEGVMSNVFWIKNNTLYTPDLRHCGVKGIARDLILKEADNQAIDTRVGFYPLRSINDAEAMFFCNSVLGVMPVLSFDDKTFKTIKHPLVKFSHNVLDARESYAKTELC